MPTQKPGEGIPTPEPDVIRPPAPPETPPPDFPAEVPAPESDVISPSDPQELPPPGPEVTLPDGP